MTFGILVSVKLLVGVTLDDVRLDDAYTVYWQTQWMKLVHDIMGQG